MQGDLVRAGIKSEVYLEEPSPSSLYPHPMYQQIVSPSKDFERLSSFHVPCEGRWQIQTKISWKALGPSLPERDMLILLEIDQLPYYKGSITEGETGSYPEILRLKADSVVHLYVSHNSPHPAQVEYSVFFVNLSGSSYEIN